MFIAKSIVLMEQYAICPDCQSDNIGNGEGTLIVDDDIFERSCKCGFFVRTNEDGEILKLKKKVNW